MAQLASDVNNTQFVGAMDPDAVMVARFYKRAVHQTFESEKQGRPIYADVIYCEYFPAGSTLLRMDVPAQEHHKQRFAKQWAYFQATQKEDTEGAGTPLSQWAILSPADVENLRGMKFYTIENIAAMSDLQMQSLGMGIAKMAPHVLRARAQAYLGSAQDSALPQKQAQDIEALKQQIARLEAALMEKPPVKEDKRKRKLTAEERAAVAERFRKGRERAQAEREAQSKPE